jgi:hypothetical protein
VILFALVRCRPLLLAALLLARLAPAAHADDRRAPTSARPVAKGEDKSAPHSWDGSGIHEGFSRPDLRGPALRSLAKRVEFEGFEADPKMPLLDALEELADKFDLVFDVDELAFRAEMVKDVLGTPVAEKPLPKMANASLESILRKLLVRVPSRSGVTFLVRRDYIEITTEARARKEAWPAGYAGPFLPLVHIDIPRRPLAEALKDLTERTGFNIVVDSRVEEKAQTLVAAAFTNVPLDTAVEWLAEMADLKPFLVDNLLYVTTPANAAKLEERHRLMSDLNAAPRGVSGQGPGSRHAGPMQQAGPRGTAGLDSERLQSARRFR